MAPDLDSECHERPSLATFRDACYLARISHKPLGNLETSVFPSISSGSFGNVYEHSLQAPLEISKKHLV